MGFDCDVVLEGGYLVQRCKALQGETGGIVVVMVGSGWDSDDVRGWLSVCLCVYIQHSVLVGFVD